MEHTSATSWTLIDPGSILLAKHLYTCLVPDKDAQGTNMFSQRTKTWTFPNLKAPAGPAEVYLAVEEEEEEPVSFGSPFRAVLL